MIWLLITILVAFALAVRTAGWIVRRRLLASDTKRMDLAATAELLKSEMLTAEEQEKIKARLQEKLQKELARQPALNPMAGLVVSKENAPGGFPVILKKENDHG